MKGKTLQTYRQRLLRVILYIQEHLEEELSLDDLARLSHFSPYHFHRLFRAMVGEPVHQYVRRLRLELAAVRLKQTDTPIVELALGSGYETHESFTRAFKSMFGVSPSQFRHHQATTPLVQTGLGMVLDLQKLDKKINIEVKRLSPQRIAFVRHVGPYDQVGSAFERLMAWAALKGLIGPDAKVLGVSYDDPNITPTDKIRYDASLTVDEEVGPEGDIGVRELPGGDYAVVCHQGPYHELGRTYDYIYGHWLPTSGREPADIPPFELYINHPESTDPEELLTDVHVPLKD